MIRNSLTGKQKSFLRSMLQNCMELPADAIAMLAERADANLVQVIGRNGLLFKRNFEKPKIELP